MKRKNLQKEELDRIGVELLEMTRLGNEEIERVIAKPQIFSGVKARIRIEQSERDSKKLFGNRGSLSVLNNRKYFAAAGVLAFFAIGALGLVLFNKVSWQSDLAYAPEIQTQSAPIERRKDARVYAIEPEPTTAKSSAIKPRESTAKRIDFKKENVKPQKSVWKTNFIKKQKPLEFEPKREFYALTYAENPIPDGESLRIVRAELSRSSLFALGVNLPIENESEKIKTDLLVDADGVARAIRLID